METYAEFYRLIDVIPVPIVVSQYDGAEVTMPYLHRTHYINQTYRKVVGYSIEDIPDLDTWFRIAYPDPDYCAELKQHWYDLVAHSYAQGLPTASMDACVMCKNGAQRWFNITSEIVSSIQPDYYITTFIDIDNYKKAQAHLEKLAQTDELTQLPNRRNMVEALDREIQRAQRTRQSFVLVLADIDDFKYFNDNYGHECGDRLLQQIAAFCTSQLRGSDVVARWGGEEFCLLLPETDIDGSIALLQRFREALEKTEFVYRQTRLIPTFTFGVTLYRIGDDIDATLRKADVALYHGKRSGKDSIVLYNMLGT